MIRKHIAMKGKKTIPADVHFKRMATGRSARAAMICDISMLLNNITSGENHYAV
jgi:hypothetical protein